MLLNGTLVPSMKKVPANAKGNKKQISVTPNEKVLMKAKKSPKKTS